jgi:group II intron reverse transcriptase/maturase
MGTLSLRYVSPGLQRIAELARKAPETVFNSIHHLVDLDLLREAYRLTPKDRAVGVDGQTAAAYAENPEGNLRDLLDRFKSGRYHAPPVRRKHIPKGEGSKTRPIGIPTFEDKVLQRAVATVLEAIYEQDFLDCSYGFRPGRSAHQALANLWTGVMKMHGGWVIELDIEKFFDTLDRPSLRAFLDQRVQDGVLRRTIDAWLKAGVLEDGALSYPESGTPQGGVVSPLLANIYLHEVLDRWFNGQIVPRLAGQAFLVRYADDAVLVFESAEDARRVLAVLPKRFGRYNLKLHPEKTRLVRFVMPARQLTRRTSLSAGGPGSFDFLGFNHYWAKARSGSWVLKRQTARDRLRRSIRRASEWCRTYRHWPIKWQHDQLVRKLRGHYAYYGITSNGRRLNQFFYRVRRLWYKWLNRRSQRKSFPWERFERLLSRYPLPPARIVHSIYRQAANP